MNLSPDFHFTNVFQRFLLLGFILLMFSNGIPPDPNLARFFNVFCSWASFYKCFPMVLAPGLPLPPSQIEWICYQIFISPKFFNGFCSRASCRPSFLCWFPPWMTKIWLICHQTFISPRFFNVSGPHFRLLSYGFGAPNKINLSPDLHFNKAFSMIFAHGLHFTIVFLWFWLLGFPCRRPK